MKKNYSILTLVLIMLAFSACKDNDDFESYSSPKTPDDDYTVIFWGMSGGNEEDTFNDLLDILKYRQNGRIGDKVNFYGLLKTSDRHGIQADLQAYGYGGTQLIDLGEVSEGESFPDSVHTAQDYANIYKHFNATQYGDTQYPLNSPDSLSHFIKMAAQKYPAKKYILLLFGHGSGYNPTEEYPNAVGYDATRGCVYDDQHYSECLTADNIVSAVNTSGVDISLMFFQNCLMATLENMAAYQHCTDYIVASDEVTYGGYMQEFVAQLSQAGPTETAMVRAADATVDYYSTKWGEEMTYTSHGRYDLTQTDALMDIVRGISQWYSTAYDKDAAYINDRVNSTTISLDLGTDASDIVVMERDSIYKFLQKASNTTETISEDEIKTFVANITDVMSYPANKGLVFADFVKKTCDSRELSTNLSDADFNTLQTLYGQYMTQLKNMAHISVNHGRTDITDYNYLLASPTVNVFTMNAAGFHPMGVWTYYINGSSSGPSSDLESKIRTLVKAMKEGDEATWDELYNELFEGTYLARTSTLSIVENFYTASQFDITTKWSTFLKKLTDNPTYLTNPGRVDYK